jgi:hypothetical protein
MLRSLFLTFKNKQNSLKKKGISITRWDVEEVGEDKKIFSFSNLIVGPLFY